MDFSEVSRRRRMVRRFTDAVVADADLAAVLGAAARAPSAGFTQGVSYLALSGERVGDFWAATTDDGPADGWLTGMRTAPVLVLVWTSEADYLERYARPDKGWTDRDPDRFAAPYWWVDAGMGAMAALLAATDRGLGACFFGVPPERQSEVRARFGVPPDQLSVGVIALGHPADSGPPRRRARRSVVHRDGWGT